MIKFSLRQPAATVDHRNGSGFNQSSKALFGPCLLKTKELKYCDCSMHVN